MSEGELLLVNYLLLLAVVQYPEKSYAKFLHVQNKFQPSTSSPSYSLLKANIQMIDSYYIIKEKRNEDALGSLDKMKSLFFKAHSLKGEAIALLFDVWVRLLIQKKIVNMNATLRKEIEAKLKKSAELFRKSEDSYGVYLCDSFINFLKSGDLNGFNEKKGGYSYVEIEKNNLMLNLLLTVIPTVQFKKEDVNQIRAEL